ncbi:MAG TPA: nucleotidyltransferase domain-containing protein [Mycobacteriales bacterium]|nr:nucleotidyltransferase domain-containing protein [Mycobacteriales bacterium]
MKAADQDHLWRAAKPPESSVQSPRVASLDDHNRYASILLDMDVSDPTRAVTPTLDGPVLAVLAASGRPLTVGQVAQQAARGSEIGIRRSLARLVEQGIVRATLMGRNQVHELNRDHVAAEVAVLLSDLRNRLWENFRSEFTNWKVQPLFASVFGSVARGDGDDASDIDLFIVHPPFPGEPKPPRLTSTIKSQFADALGAFAVAAEIDSAAAQWEQQLDALRDKAERWTGNSLQVVDLSFHEWRHPAEAHLALLQEIQRDGIELHRIRAMSIWSAGTGTDG